MINTIRMFSVSVAAVSFCLLVPAFASAGPIVTINDTSSGMSATVTGGSNVSAVAVQEAVGVLGSETISFEYSRDKVGNSVPDGFTLHFNVFESVSSIGDTLSIVVTKLNNGNNDNTGVQIVFTSESTDGKSPAALTDPIKIDEQDALQTVVNDSLADAALTVRFNSAPEPSTIALLGTGIAGMAGYGWRRRKATH
jgi:hypothetical protein